VRAVKKTRKPKTIKAAHPQAKVAPLRAAVAVDQAAPVADQALVKACPPAALVVEVPVDRAEVKECPKAPVVVNLVKGRAEAPAVVNSNPRS